MTSVEVRDSGEIRITANGTTIAEFWLPESDRLDMVVKLLESVKKKPTLEVVKENPTNDGGV